MNYIKSKVINFLLDTICWLSGRHLFEVIDADGKYAYLQCTQCGKGASAFTHPLYTIEMNKKI
jgi:hypothetical protein